MGQLSFESLSTLKIFAPGGIGSFTCEVHACLPSSGEKNSSYCWFKRGMHMFVWLHFFVYYRYIERWQYPSCLLVDNSKRYCLKLVWKLFGPLLPFSYFPFCNKSSHRNMVGVLWKLVTFMLAPFGVSMDLYRDLRLSFT